MSSRKAPSALAEQWRSSTPGPTCATPISRFEPGGGAAMPVIPGDPMKSPAIEGRRSREEPYVLDDQVGFVLRQAQQRRTTIFAAEMIEGLTPTQWAALAKLRECGPCSQNHLGRLTFRGVQERRNAIAKQAESITKSARQGQEAMQNLLQS